MPKSGNFLKIYLSKSGKFDIDCTVFYNLRI